MIKIHTYDTEIEWPSILILGAIHWNEVCWTKAIEKFCQNIEDSKVSLKKWKVTFVPICNYKAYNKWVIYIEENLNRIIWEYEKPSTYEQNCANRLSKIIKEHDYVLDLHSTTEDTPPFAFQDFDDAESVWIVQALCLDFIITGWTKIYDETSVSSTIDYAYSQWKKWVLIECWQHSDLGAQSIAYNSISNFCKYLEIIDWDNSQEKNSIYIELQSVIYKKKDGKFFWKKYNFQKIKKWEIIAIYNDGEKLTAEHDFYMIMPNDNVKVWEDWYYEWVYK